MKQIFLRNLLLPFAFFFSLSLTTNAQTGFAYRDLNANGAKDAGEPGVSGIQVKSFQSSGAILGNATTAADGSYTLSPKCCCCGGGGQNVRVEFYIVTGVGCRPASSNDQAGYNGTLDGSSVKFVVGPASAQNFAVANINEYYINDPKVFIPIWGNGNPLGGGTRATDTAFVMFNYQNNGYAPTAPVHNVSYPNAPARVPLAKASQIGSCWGVAYSRFADRVFTSAVVKRQIGLGPLGSGGIYLINPNVTYNSPSGGDVTNFIDLDALGIATRTAGYTARGWGYGQINMTCGAGTPADNATFNPRVPFSAQVGSNTDRGLAANGGLSDDIAAFSQVGKVGIGDIELSEDGRYLFVTNLFDQRIYRIDLTKRYKPCCTYISRSAN
ncbi:MAG: hypothetical protein IPP48_07875 [Chitinophagaceae bacterium]|nr:hypothetical protein [Chitinophagaceae bacterium]